jgi:organic hydroperoxide reductase OsmC/OhrA
MPNHYYEIGLTWTGNLGEGTLSYKGYDRLYTISKTGKPDILGSSDPAFRGDKSRHNPEDLLVASISSCHMLWYLHLCSVAGVVVTGYVDQAKGTMVENKDGSGYFSEVILYPVVTVKDESMIEKAMELHKDAHKMCFVANSCNFPIRHEPRIIVKN